MPYSIIYDAHPSAEDIQFLNDGITHEAKTKKGMKPLEFFAFYLRDEKQAILGGCGGTNLYGGLLVDQLWVSADLRGQGYGSQLMQSAEKLARDSGCKFMAVNTFDWEALEFYKKLGFFVEFERKGFDKGSVFYYLRKNLE